MKATLKAEARSTMKDGTVAYVHSKCRRRDGSYDSFRTQAVPLRMTQAPRSGVTASGFGVAQPTPYEVLFNGRWRRVRVAKGHRTSTAYIGRTYDECLTVQIVPA
jgi:hypothetical protein